MYERSLSIFVPTYNLYSRLVMKALLRVIKYDHIAARSYVVEHFTRLYGLHLSLCIVVGEIDITVGTMVVTVKEG